MGSIKRGIVRRNRPYVVAGRRLVLGAVLLLAALGAVATQAEAAGPAWSLHVAGADRAAPGSTFEYRLYPRNVGDADASGPGTLEITLPAGLTGLSIGSGLVPGLPPLTWSCGDPAATTVQCDTSFPIPVPPGEQAREPLILTVAVAPGTSGALSSTFELSGGGAVDPVTVSSVVEASPVPDFEVKVVDGAVSDAAGATYTQAAGHPDSASVSFELNRAMQDGYAKADGGGLKDVEVDLPAGLIGNPTVVPACPKDLRIPSNKQAREGDFDPNTFCSLSSIVGVAAVVVTLKDGNAGRYVAPVFNLEPPPGVAAQFGFSFVDQKTLLNATVRSDGNYGVTVVARNASQAKPVLGSTVTLWGVPADHSHDDQRCMAFFNPAAVASGADPSGFPEDAPLPTCTDPEGLGRSWLLPAAANIKPLAFLTNPTACTLAGTGLLTTLRFTSWNPTMAPASASFVSHLSPGFPAPPAQWGAPQGPTGCDKVPFDPEVQAQADSRLADSPSGLSVDLSMPQGGLSNPSALATAHLKRATVTLPEGWSLSPSSADKLVGCSDAQSGVGTRLRARCPDAARIGTVEATTPLLKEKLSGGVYVGTQESDDPLSGRMYRMFIALNNEERGVYVKLAGQVRVDPGSGRIETTFDNNPQVPVDRISLRLDSGPRAPLATPFDCGAKTVAAQLESWAGTVVNRTSELMIDCPGAGALAPAFRAGVTRNFAGRHSSFVLRAERPDRQQVMNGLALRMPPGLLAKLKGVPECPDAAANVGACPEGSRVGTVTVGSGPGTNPFFLQGTVYLTGPYKRGPFGLVAVVRAKAGPFDLGNVVVRQQLLVDPVDAHVDVVSDPLPTILKGVPLRLRSLNVDVDREDFVLNPTSCSKRAIVAAFGSPGGPVFNASSPFGVGNCAALGLKPKLRLALTGRRQTTAGKHPGVKAVLTQRRGDANLKRVQVKLPLSLALDPENAQALCEFADGTKVDPTCPRGSIVGRARAVTPILDEPLTAPVFFVKNVRRDPRTGRPIRTLPMLVIPLRGENGIKLNLKGTSAVARGGQLVNTFAAIPDAPVSRFELTIKGGRNGILAANGNICRRPQRAAVQIDGQNNKVSDRLLSLAAPCKGRRTRVAERDESRRAQS